MLIPLSRFLPHRAARSLAAFTAFLVGFTVLLIIVCRWYLIPAFIAAQHATPAERRVLAIHSWLMLAVVLFILLVLIILTFRLGRFFMRSDSRPKPTVYPDAWEEAGRRLQTPPKDM